MRSSSVRHHWGLKGYMFIYIFLYIGFSVLLNIAEYFLGMLDAIIPWGFWVAIKIVFHFSAAFIAANRFMSIENRSPDHRQRDYIALFGFLMVLLCMVLFLPAFVGMNISEGATRNAAVQHGVTSLAILSGASFVSLYLCFGFLSKEASAEP